MCGTMNTHQEHRQSAHHFSLCSSYVLIRVIGGRISDDNKQEMCSLCHIGEMDRSEAGNVQSVSHWCNGHD